MSEKKDWKRLYLRLFADHHGTLAELIDARNQYGHTQDALNNALRDADEQRKAKHDVMREKSDALVRALRAEGARDVLVEMMTKERAK
jgi:hypothetical protein